jgi:hypothetical protein
MQSDALSAPTVDSTLAAVLARPEFAPLPVSPLRQLMGRGFGWLRDRLGELLEWLLPNLDPTAAGWSMLGRVVLFVLGLVGLWLIVRLARIGLGAARRRSEKHATIDISETSRPLTPDEWERRAREAVNAGIWREAVIALYQAVIGRLAENGAVRADPAKTPGDYRREVRGDARVGPGLESFLRQFEPVVFGRRAADADAYARLRDAAAPLGARG